MPGIDTDDLNKKNKSRAEENDKFDELIPDDAIEAAAGIDCSCTYLPSRLSTTLYFVDAALIKIIGRK